MYSNGPYANFICVFVKKRKMVIYTRSSGHNSSMANLYTNEFLIWT